MCEGPGTGGTRPEVIALSRRCANQISNKAFERKAETNSSASYLGSFDLKHAERVEGPQVSELQILFGW